MTVVHAIRNHLAVAVANVEGFRDGMFEPTPRRLDAVLHALAQVDMLLGAGGESAARDIES